jgi:hypothetical protein
MDAPDSTPKCERGDSVKVPSLVVAMLGAVVLVQSAAGAELRMGEVRIAQSLGKKDSVVVVVTVASQDTSSVWSGRMWGGEQSEPTARHVAEIKIAWTDSAVWVPLSAYADLGDPRSIEFVEAAKGISFTVRGGDTSTYYAAQFFVERGVLKRRRVSLAEFPDEIWQETTYSGPVRDNR